MLTNGLVQSALNVTNAPIVTIAPIAPVESEEEVFLLFFPKHEG